MSLIDFYNELGEYVYCYTKDGTYQNAYYKGKGVGDRCTHHVKDKDKDYDINDCYIVARNLEKFRKKSPSFLLESFLIWDHDPQDNKVSGHYKECFIMKNLSFLLDEYDASQRDLWKETDELRNAYPEAFNGKLGRTETKKSISRIETGWKDSLQFSIILKTSSDKYGCLIGWKGAEEKFIPKQEHFKKEYPELNAELTSTTIEWDVDTADEAIEFWNSFTQVV